VLLPPAYVQPYRRRSKTDRADCEAILEADRCAGIHPVSIKSEDQQALLALHRVRSQWLQTGTARINAMRGFLSEFGVIAQLGAKRFTNDLPALLSNRPELPARVRIAINELWAEVRDVKSRIDVVEHELEACAADEPFVQAQLRIPGIGVLTASALFATIGSIHTFKSGRQLAWRVLLGWEAAAWGHQQARRSLPGHSAPAQADNGRVLIGQSSGWHPVQLRYTLTLGRSPYTTVSWAGAHPNVSA
jgi:transposase